MNTWLARILDAISIEVIPDKVTQASQILDFYIFKGITNAPRTVGIIHQYFNLYILACGWSSPLERIEIGPSRLNDRIACTRSPFVNISWNRVGGKCIGLACIIIDCITG